MHARFKTRITQVGEERGAGWQAERPQLTLRNLLGRSWWPQQAMSRKDKLHTMRRTEG